MKSRDWRLVRAALVKIGDEDSPQIGYFQLGPTEVVRTCGISIKGKRAGSVCVASVPVELEPESDLAALLNGQARRDAETALELLARFSAIEERTTHELSSTDPFIGITSDNLDDLAQLDGQPVALESGELRIRGENIAPMNILKRHGMAPFIDRLGGVALLAEALNSRSPLGRYSQLIRLFENAFRSGPKDLTEPLANFLAGSEHWFKPEEVAKWTEARSYAFHADRRPDIYLDFDVKPFASRMLEAGLRSLAQQGKMA